MVNNGKKAVIDDGYNIRYEFPKSENISIQRDFLQIQLEKFKKANLASFSTDVLFDLLITLLALWVPVFTSNFRGLFTVSSEVVQGAYVAFAMFASLYVIYRHILSPILFFFKNRKNKISADSEIMSSYILEQCSKKK